MRTAYRHSSIALLTLLAASALSACGDEATGDVAFVTWGEEFIEDGIPADADEGGFVDEWAVEFDRFLVTFGELSMKSADESLSQGTNVLVNLASTSANGNASGERALFTFSEVTEGTWANVGWYNATASASTTAHASATASDLEIMKDGGYAVYVEGTATKGEETIEFAWGFPFAVRYDQCQTDQEGKIEVGVVVSNGSTTSTQLTIHGDHFFYDAFDDEAEVRFQAIADADADEDGEVTLAELGEVSLTEARESGGRYSVELETGGVLDVDDLRGFLEAQMVTLGHFNGEGHCNGVIER